MSLHNSPKKRSRYVQAFTVRPRRPPLRKSGIEAAVLDFESPETIAAAFKGIDTLFLVIVTPGSPGQERHEENLLGEAKRVGVERIVKLSGKIADHHTVGHNGWTRDPAATDYRTDSRTEIPAAPARPQPAGTAEISFKI
jgi:hypothetical protein